MDRTPDTTAPTAATAAGPTTTGPTTTRSPAAARRHSSRDRGTVVLGGLLDQTEQVTQEKVPLLGDIPVIGALFSSEQRQKDNTNLMIFIRPVIVGSADAARSITQPELERMIQQQRLSNGGAPGLLDDVLNRMPAAPAVPLAQPASPPEAATDGGR